MEVDIDVFDLTLEAEEISESAPVSEFDDGEEIDLTGVSGGE